MDFVSADRSRDSEFEAGLKNYNFGVDQINRDITSAIKTDRDREKQTERDIDNTEIFTQIKDAAGNATGLASATATFKNYQDYAGKIAEGVKKAQKSAAATAEKVQQAKATLQTPADQLGGKVGAAAEEGGGALSDASKVADLEKAGKATVNAAKTGGETGALIGKVGTKALKGLGIVGSAAGMGMAIAADANGGWAKMSTADKIGNVAEIGGAGLDMVGVGLEATGIGVPFGLALQGLGTLLQIGSGVEGEIASKTAVDPAKKAAQQEEQEEEAQEAPKQQEIAAVSEAQAGGLGVARQQQ